jgi:hypothetical protein
VCSQSRLATAREANRFEDSVFLPRQPHLDAVNPRAMAFRVEADRSGAFSSSRIDFQKFGERFCRLFRRGLS